MLLFSCFAHYLDARSSAIQWDGETRADAAQRSFSRGVWNSLFVHRPRIVLPIGEIICIENVIHCFPNETHPSAAR
jgi:hypothetical protein